jgi:hypothetical protein
MTSLLTWAAGPYSTHVGTAAGIRLFGITWKSQRENPNWLMRSELPGLAGREWKDDDLQVLQAVADEVLAGWLGQIAGLQAPADEEAACDVAFEDWWENKADLGGDWHPFAEQTYLAGWQARAARGKGGAS